MEPCVEHPLYELGHTCHKICQIAAGRSDTHSMTCWAPAGCASDFCKRLTAPNHQKPTPCLQGGLEWRRVASVGDGLGLGQVVGPCAKGMQRGGPPLPRPTMGFFKDIFLEVQNETCS